MSGGSRVTTTSHQGTIIVSTGAHYQVRLHNQACITAQLIGQFRLAKEKYTNPIAVGDEVLITVRGALHGALITKRFPRENLVARPAPLRKHYLQAIATNIGQIAIVMPPFVTSLNALLLDRLLVVAESSGIPPLIIWNKVDLCSDLNALNGAKSYYSKLDYKTVVTSVAAAAGMDELRRLLAGKRTLLLGPSGVGKSSILNHFVPQASQATQELNKKGLGKHTTRVTRLFEVPGEPPGTELIDAPGMLIVRLGAIELHSLGQFFPEIKVRVGRCKYYNCLHKQEPSCAVEEAVKAGTIRKERYQSYLTLLREQEEAMPY